MRKLIIRLALIGKKFNYNLGGQIDHLFICGKYYISPLVSSLQVQMVVVEHI